MGKNSSMKDKSFSVQIGDNASMVAVGENIKQVHLIQIRNNLITDEDIILAKELFNQLREKIKKEVVSNKAKEAIKKISKIEEALIGKKPKPGVLKDVGHWLMKNTPDLLGTLKSVFFHPIIIKLADAAGEIVTEEFKQFIQRL